MEHTSWNHLYTSWGWLLWLIFWYLMISSFGNWGYTYRVHRRLGSQFHKTALEILNERYAKGEISQEEFLKMKAQIGVQK